MRNRNMLSGQEMQTNRTLHAGKKVLTVVMVLLLITSSLSIYSFAGVEDCEHIAGEVQIENQVPPGCTEPGSQDEVVYCMTCGAELSRNTISIPASHTPGQAVRENEIPVTCTTPGSHDEVEYCTVCGEELSRVSTQDAAPGHTSGEVVYENEIPASCSTPGSYDAVVYCQVCGTEISRDTYEIPVTDHVPGEAVCENEVLATETVPGSHDEVIYCQACGAELSRKTIEDPAPEETEDLFEAIQPVTVIFTINAQNADITVWSGTDSIDPESDQTWLLTPGDYIYTAEAEGYETIEAMPLHVDEAVDTNPVIVQVRMGVNSGTCGYYDDKLKWELDKEGKLTIFLDQESTFAQENINHYEDIYAMIGSMADYQDEESGYGMTAPWYERRDDIKTVEIQEGVTSIGSNAFRGCHQLETIKIPGTMKSIGNNAFYECDALKTIEYLGSNQQWDGIEIEENNLVFSTAEIRYAVIIEEKSTEIGLPEKEDGLGEDKIAPKAVETTVEETSVSEKTAEAEEDIAVPMPAFGPISKKVDKVVITVSAPEGVFPACASLQVEKVPVSKEAQVEEAIESERDENVNVAVSYSFDITIIDENGNYLQPTDGSKVQVKFALDEVGNENLNTNVYHVSEDEATHEMEVTALEVEEDTSGRKPAAIIETDGFSIYQVEFTYDIKQYILPGGKSVPLATILEEVGLAGNVQMVSVSEEELFSASNETGEWVVTAHQAFNSTEWMNVTINGVVYEITVTDDNTGAITLTTAVLINSSNKSTYEGSTITGTVPSDQYKGIIADNHFDGGVVVDGIELNLTIDGLNTDYSGRNGTVSGISLVNGATLHLTVMGENTLKAGFGGAGISVPAGCTLEITSGSTGTLNAVGGRNYGGGAGIGSIGDGNNTQYYMLYPRSLGSIVINGGTINAQGGTWYHNNDAAAGAAGIGGSELGDGTGSITINGGTVTATGGGYAAGIGGGFSGTIQSITINGGTVTANGNNKSAAIGTGYNGYNTGAGTLTGPTIAINDGTVTANGNIGFGDAVDASQNVGGSITLGESAVINCSGSIIAGGHTYYKVSFDANGGTGSKKPIYVAEGSYTLPSCDFTPPSGQLFAGWNLGKAGEMVQITADTVLQAQWAEIITIHFDAGRGRGTMADGTGLEGERYTLPSCSFTPPEGETFWYWQVNNEVAKSYPGEAIALYQNRTVTAIWSGAKPVITSWENETVTISESTGIQNRIQVSGNVTLEIKKDAVLYAPQGIYVPKGASLTIRGEGTLTIDNVESKCAGIGGNSSAYVAPCGSIIIEGCTINVTGGKKGAGIGTGFCSTAMYNGSDTSITISGGTITATGGVGGAGIGGILGDSGVGTYVETINISGGRVYAQGGGCGIGNGVNKGTISLRWTNAADSIYAQSYSGTVNLDPDSLFVLENTNTQATKDNIGDKTIVPAKTVRVSPAANGAVSLPGDAENDSLFGIGSTVVLTVAPDSGYQVSSVRYGTNEIEPVEGIYSFKMPANDVTVSATFEKIPATSPTITMQPGNLDLKNGADSGNVLTVAAKAIADHMLSYQWYSNTTKSVNGSTPVSSATDASYAVPTNSDGTVYYYCVVTATRTDNGETTSATSNIAAVTVTSHKHNYTYSASGATITAACDNTDEKCWLTNCEAVLTIVAPTLTTYGEKGKDANATVIGSIDDVTNPDIVYKKGSDTLNSAPTDAGTYTASITLNQATASVQYTIAKADITPSVSIEGWTYGNTPKTPSVSGNTGSGDVIYTYAPKGTTTFSDTVPTNAGEYSVKASIVATDNYNGSETTSDFTISKANQTAPAAPTKASATINSITLTAVDGCEYKIGTDGAWQESPIFTGLTMNTEYAFYQRLKKDANHNASPESQLATLRTNDHAHEWSYEANGAIITATCANTDGGHTGELTVTMTINAPALTVYGGSGSAEATITGSIDSVTNPNIVYKKGNETLDAAPTNAGTYTASITLDQATASVEYTIAQAATTIMENPATSEIIYGQKLDNCNLTGGMASQEGSFAWKDSTVAPAVSDSQKTEYDVVFTPTDGNYGIAECKVKLTVNKAESAVTKAPEAKTLTYTGSAEALVTAGEATGGEIQYALGTVTEATQPYTRSIPVKTDAGTYYVWYMVNGDENHHDTAPVCIPVIIQPDSSEGEGVTANSLVYTGEPQALVTKGTARGGTMLYALGQDTQTPPEGGWSEDVPSGTEAKTYYVWYMVRGDQNHNDTKPEAVTVKVRAPISATVTFKVVNGAWNEGEGEAAAADRIVTLTGYEGDTLKLSTDQIPAVGSKPNDTYQTGGWDAAPSTETEIKGDTTYTYTYAKIPIQYKATEGAGTEYKPGSDGTLTFVFKRSEHDEDTFKHFTGLRYDGQLLTRDKDYTAKAGSVIVELQNSFLKGVKAGDHTLTAEFDDGVSTDVAFKVLEATTYIVTFNTNGRGSAPAAQSVIEGQKAKQPTALTAQGYTFGGWYKEKECQNAFSFDTPITGDITLYAKWTAASSSDNGTNTSGSAANTQGGASGSGANRSTPGTGDTNNTLLWILLLVASLLAIGTVVFVVIRKKQMK